MASIGKHRPALKEEVRELLGIEAGVIGPMNQKIRIVADATLMEGIYVSGANKPHFHAKGIRPKKDFSAEWHDIHVAKAGDFCPKCGTSLRVEKAIEIGNIFMLGTKYSVPLRASYLDKNGQEKPIIMGSYGIGPARIAAAAIEQNHDKDGIIWPKSIAPFDVEILPLNMKDQKTVEIAEEIYNDLSETNFEVLIDDRDERAGVKFKDADLIGIPLHVIIGEKNLKEGFIEIKDRKTKAAEKVTIEGAIENIRDKIEH